MDYFGDLQHPPEGPFCTDDLVWSRKHRRGKAVQEAVIPSSRLEDFISGEGVRGMCAITKVSSKAPAAEGNRSDSLGWKQTYHCSHGPEDYSQPTGEVFDFSQKPSSGPGSRPNSKRATGASQKRGCQCRFMAAPLHANPERTLLRYSVMEHRNHGPACPEGAAGWATLPPRLSSGAKGWIHTRLLLDPGVNCCALVEQLREEVVVHSVDGA